MFKHFKILSFTITMFLIKQNVVAQQFLNGDFEINTCGGADQINIQNSQFDAFMTNTFAFGTWGGGVATGGDMDIITSATWGGSGAQNGSWYVALTGGGTDMFAMQLCAPLIAGNTYTMSYWDRVDASYISDPTQVGLSATNNAFGTVIYTAPVAPTNNTWVQRSFTFVAPITGLYVTVQQTGIFSGSNWCHVDNFSLTTNNNQITVGAITGSPFCACSTFNIPFTSTGTFNAGNVYTAQLSDSTGSFATPTTIGTLASTANAGTIACTIPCNAVSGSLYQVQIVSSNPINTSICGGVSSVNITIGGSATVTVNSPTICTGQTANLVATGATTYTWTAGVTVTGLGTGDASPAATTTYTVTGTSGGCTGTAVATVTVVPSLTVTVTSDTICPGSTAHLVANGANTYTWSAGATSTGVNTADASPITTTTYTVTGNSGLCSATAVATVTISNVLNVAVNSATICAGQTAALTATGATTYTWSAGATSTGVNTATANPVTTTSYTVTGTSGTCTNTAVATVTVHPVPNVLVNSATICSGDTAHLVANGAASYTWSAGAIVTGGNTAMALPVTTATYTVTGTTNNCSNTAISTVTVNQSPVITVNTDTICQGQTTTLTATGANSYLWSSGFSGNPYTVTLNVTTFFSVTGTTNGCSTIAGSTVYVFPPAVVHVNVDTVCPGQAATLTATGATTYLWNTGSTANPYIVSPLSTTTYTVTGNPTGCPGTATTTVQVMNIIPNINVNPVTVCAGQSATLTATGANNYTWSTGATTASITVSPATTTTYTVTTTNQCNNTATANPVVTVNVNPVAQFATLDTGGCAPLCVPFINTSTVSAGTITNWAWAFGDNTVDNTQNPPLHCYANSGNYSVQLVVTASDGCTNTLTQNNYIHVYPVPVADFSATPTETNLDNPAVSFFDHSTGATTWYWNFGDSTHSSLTYPTHTYTTPGTYPVMEIVTSANGCKDTLINFVIINDNFAFYAPNTITPNEDGTNDVFLPVGTGWNTATYQLWIFDRWGNTCFTTTDYKKGWDGKANGGSTTAQNDVYVWKVELKDTGGASHKYIGQVTILK